MDKPNFILISADNLGYGDWGCFGSTVHRTPHTDRMAADGMRLTHFYSSSGVCTPSRASLMTGCYPRRVGMHFGGYGTAVLMPLDSKGLHPSEITIARLLQGAGYATTCIGKWHLGDQAPFLPTRHGFDSYFGVPYSDDMTPREARPEWPPLPLMQDETVIEAGVDRNLLTRRYTEAAVAYIREHRDQPFFLYLPHAMPGSTPRPFASPAVQGTSANGPYGDSIEEMDWSTGEILAALAECGIDERTLVLTTSDHGPIPNDPPQGSAGPLVGDGYTTSERGMRPPCVVRWPGVVPAGSECSEVTSVMDILPTFARLAGVEAPTDRTIDGHDISALLRGDAGVRSAYDESGFFYYQLSQLQAVRSGRYKLYLPLTEKIIRLNRQESAPSELALYDLVDDVGETTNIAAAHPEIVARLTDLAEAARADIGDHQRHGAGERPAGWMADPQPCVIA
jgi:arylsulfatase A-like enzyme